MWFVLWLGGFNGALFVFWEESLALLELTAVTVQTWEMWGSHPKLHLPRHSGAPWEQRVSSYLLSLAGRGFCWNPIKSCLCPVLQEFNSHHLFHCEGRLVLALSRVGWDQTQTPQKVCLNPPTLLPHSRLGQKTIIAFLTQDGLTSFLTLLLSYSEPLQKQFSNTVVASWSPVFGCLFSDCVKVKGDEEVKAASCKDILGVETLECSLNGPHGAHVKPLSALLASFRLLSHNCTGWKQHSRLLASAAGFLL